MSAFADFLGKSSKKVTKAALEEMAAISPKRVCFGSTHTRSLRRSPSGPKLGYFNVPFSETFNRVFPWDLHKGRYGYFAPIDTEARYSAVNEWIKTNTDRVFIRSLMSSAVALSLQYGDDGRTTIGELEYRAKYRDDHGASDELLEISEEVARSLYGSIALNAVMAIPPSVKGVVGLPQSIASGLSSRLGLPDLTDAVSWRSSKPSIKGASLSEKWDKLAAVGLEVDSSIHSRRVLLVDDMYQSGTTAHFVASALYRAGVKEVHCFALSKSLGDRDNT